MISFDIERLEILREELEPLLKIHWEEIALNKDKIPLDVDWESYLSLEKTGSLLTITARQNQELIGYAIWFIRKHLHYKQTSWAYNDVIYLKKEHRLIGTGGQLVRICEQVLTEMGVEKIQWHVKSTMNWTKLLENMGYQTEEYVCGKYVGE